MVNRHHADMTDPFFLFTYKPCFILIKITHGFLIKRIGWQGLVETETFNMPNNIASGIYCTQRENTQLLLRKPLMLRDLKQLLVELIRTQRVLKPLPVIPVLMLRDIALLQVAHILMQKVSQRAEGQYSCQKGFSNNGKR